MRVGKQFCVQLSHVTYTSPVAARNAARGSAKPQRDALARGGAAAPSHERAAAVTGSADSAPRAGSDARTTASAPAFDHSGCATPAHEWWSGLHSTTRTMRPSPPDADGNHAVVKLKLKAVVPLACEMSAAPPGAAARSVTTTE